MKHNRPYSFDEDTRATRKEFSSTVSTCVTGIKHQRNQNVVSTSQYEGASSPREVRRRIPWIAAIALSVIWTASQSSGESQGTLTVEIQYCGRPVIPPDTSAGWRVPSLSMRRQVPMAVSALGEEVTGVSP